MGVNSFWKLRCGNKRDGMKFEFRWKVVRVHGVIVLILREDDVFCCYSCSESYGGTTGSAIRNDNAVLGMRM